VGTFSSDTANILYQAMESAEPEIKTILRKQGWQPSKEEKDRATIDNMRLKMAKKATVPAWTNLMRNAVRTLIANNYNARPLSEEKLEQFKILFETAQIAGDEEAMKKIAKAAKRAIASDKKYRAIFI
jgi:hypothetical protein